MRKIIYSVLISLILLVIILFTIHNSSTSNKNVKWNIKTGPELNIISIKELTGIWQKGPISKNVNKKEYYKDTTFFKISKPDTSKSQSKFIVLQIDKKISAKQSATDVLELMETMSDMDKIVGKKEGKTFLKQYDSYPHYYRLTDYNAKKEFLLLIHKVITTFKDKNNFEYKKGQVIISFINQKTGNTSYTMILNRLT
ncbi:MAG TPA: hypothetical protein EYG83_03885 [Sulfurospirillum arcachonense]|nr:hypothetical protein [Sulfurospirillum arcachonense]